MSSGHFTWLHSVPEAIGIPEQVASESEKLLIATGLGLLLIVFGRLSSAPIRESTIRVADGLKQLVVPPHKLSLFGFFDVFVEGFLKFHDSVLGRENRKYFPFSGTVFTFILFGNLIGLIPGVAALTTTVWVNVAIALVVFVYFNYLGIKQNGLFGYFKHFCGPVWWLVWLILPIEIFSVALRIVTLNLRLYWNISADHIVLDTFTQMTKFIIPVIFYGFGTFVCVIQALVFTILTMVYILLATQHEEAH